ncbi:uncharacterized protein [Palaemon carinicauda]|uniref:uncharacterized protein n=1 Tax=Palaemon carinicauda TaxID=392227 RepID=UPI0035B57A1B
MQRTCMKLNYFMKIVFIIFFSREGNSVEDFEQFLETVKPPVVLCGPSGSGKSTVLRRLTQRFYCEENFMKYDLVLILDSPNRFIPHLSCRDIYDIIKRKIYRSCPETVKEHKIDLCLFTLMNCGDILFLVNSNIDSDGIRNVDKLKGKWVFSSNSSPNVWSSNYCVLKIDPLDETSVKKMLLTLLSSSGYQDVNSLYDGCEYKSVINIPDMVIVFSEVREQKFVHLLLQSFLEKKISSIENATAHCKLLEKIAFYFILNNKMEYSDKDLSDISVQLRSLLFIRQEGSYVFQLRIIEDFLAARYVVANPRTAIKECVCQALLFKRVIRYACAIWNETNKLDTNYVHLKSYLEKCMDVKSSNSRKFEKNPMTNEDFSNQGTFTKWSFLISLAEYCNFHEDVMRLTCDLLAQKYTWVIKCKFMDDERKIKALFKILENVKLSKQITIRIESGVQRKTIGYVLDMLRSITGLYNFATIQIAIMHKQTVPVPCDSNISKLPTKIAQIDEPLFITKYEGPLLCSNIPNFLKCKCMRRLEILDITVYDVATLAEALSLEGLPNLKSVVIKVELRSSEGECTSLPKLRFPSLPTDVSFNVYIRYFDKFNEFLQTFEDKKQLHALTIQGMLMKENYFLDLSDFTGLEGLYINFNPHAASLENNPEGNKTCHSKPFQILIHSKLPRNLQTLLLRDAEFWNDSCISFLTKFSTQRLILLDSSVSVSGLRNILQKHASEDNLEEKMKRHCIREEQTNMCVVIQKKPRLSKEEREMRRRNKPSGKELIITSNLKMCQDFSCCCNHLDSEHKDKLEDIVGLIYDAYFYDILSLNYTSEFITIRKDLCGDLRVRCPLTDLTDDILDQCKCDKQVAKVNLLKFLEILSLAQSITLDYTRLTLTGVEKVIDKLIELKKNVCDEVEPFSLTISSLEYCVVTDEVKNSKFLKNLVSENYLKQFKYVDSNSKSKYIRKTLSNQIFINNERVEVNEAPMSY